MISNENYNSEVQSVLLSYMISEPNVFTRCQSILDPSYFDQKLRPAVRFVLEYADQFHTLPEPIQIKASTGVEVDRFPSCTPQNDDWFLTTVEGFARYRALELAVLDGMDLLQAGKGGELERRIKDAMTISLQSDLGTDYFHDPKTRLERMRDRSSYISTGWKTIDDKLYGGFTRGALNVFAGGSGSGKSLWLQNIALNWVFQGEHVVYFTLELSEDLVALRLDAMVSGWSTTEVVRDIDKSALTLRMKGKNAGRLIIKKLPEAGTTANDLRAFLKEYEIKTGVKPTAMVVDYLDLMTPNGRNIDPGNLFTKDKYTSEEMRALAGEFNLLCATGSQLNRQSVEAAEFDHSHIAGGISKINTADNVFGIFTSATMRERGVYQLQFLKTRSSSAVGSKIELRYCPISMRIMDPDEDAEQVRSMSSEELKEDMKAKFQSRNEVKIAASKPAEDEEQVSEARGDIMGLMASIRKRNDQ